MKKCIVILILTLISFSAAFAQVTMEDLKKQFKGKSMAEVRVILVDQNKQLSSLIKLSSLSIKITPGNLNTNETTTTEKFSTAPKDNIIKNFNGRLKKITFRQKLIYPNTALGIDFDPSRIIYSVDDYDDYKFPEPNLKLKKVFFKDGKTANLDQDIKEEDDDFINEIKGTKWIDSVELEASYYYPDEMSFVKLSTKNPVNKLPEGNITLVEINGNEVDLKFSEALKPQIVKVEGLNANGKAVDQSGSSSSSMNSNFSTAFLQALYQTGEDAIAKIDKNAYKNVDELVQDIYEKMPKEDKEKPEKMVNATYSFRGDVTAVNIFFKSKGNINTYNFTLKNEAEQLDGFAIAQNKKGLKGILDENGKWIIEPTFERLNYYKGNYFLGNVDEDGYQARFWLDKNNKKLIPLSIDFTEAILFSINIIQLKRA